MNYKGLGAMAPLVIPIIHFRLSLIVMCSSCDISKME
jgi:hypothetical protein